MAFELTIDPEVWENVRFLGNNKNKEHLFHELRAAVTKAQDMLCVCVCVCVGGLSGPNPCAFSLGEQNINFLMRIRKAQKHFRSAGIFARKA